MLLILYCNIVLDAIKDKREDRRSSDENLRNATTVEALKYKANVLNTNLSPSLEN